jgi:hypothetical protein
MLDNSTGSFITCTGGPPWPAYMRLYTTLWFNNGYSGWTVVGSGPANETYNNNYLEAWYDYPCPNPQGYYQGEGIGYVQAPPGAQPPSESGTSWSQVVGAPC